MAISSDNSTVPSTKSHLSRGATIGVAIGSSVALISILIVIGFLFRRWRKKVYRRMRKELSIGNTNSESKTSMERFPQEIGRNSLRKSYPELHNENIAELLDEGMISGSDKEIKELPESQEQALHELDTGTMQYSELHDVPTAELPSEDLMSCSGQEIKKLPSHSTNRVQEIHSTSDSSASTAAPGPRDGPQESHNDRFSFLRIRERIAMASPMGMPSSSNKRWSDALLVKPRPALAVASSKSLPLLPVSKYNTRSKSVSPP